jgi:hypothetical protein
VVVGYSFITHIAKTVIRMYGNAQQKAEMIMVMLGDRIKRNHKMKMYQHVLVVVGLFGDGNGSSVKENPIINDAYQKGNKNVKKRYSFI